LKKTFTLLALLLVLSLFVTACGTTGATEEPAAPAPSDEPAENVSAEVDGEAVSMGLSLSTSIGKSTDYSVDADGKETLARAQVDTIIAAVTFDSEGRVVDVIIDNAQTRVGFDAKCKSQQIKLLS
jgi:predicted small lipoprotein YifL